MSAGELSRELRSPSRRCPPASRCLREAELFDAHKDGKQVIYRFGLSVLEDALLGFAGVSGIGDVKRRSAARVRKEKGA